MPRDYVNDFGRPDPKNRSRRRGGRPQGSGGGKSNAITFLAIIVLILLCAVFFFASRSGLLKGGAGDQAAPAAQKTENPKQEAKTPERPKEKYDYMQLLESNEVVGETNDPKKADKTQKPHNAEIMDKPASTVDVRRENKQEEAKRAQEILNGSLNTRDESVTVLNDTPSSPSAPSGSGLRSETVTVERPPKMKDSEAALAESRKADAERESRRLAEQRKAEADRRAAEQKLAEQKKAEADRRAAEQKLAAQKKAEADRRAAEQKLAAQKKAEADRRAAEQKLAEQKKADADRRAAEQKLAEQKKAEADRRAAEQKLAEQKRIESEKAASQKQQAAQSASAGQAGDGRVFLQCAAFRTAQQADALKSKLRAGGLPAFVQQANVGGAVWYRVKLGPYRSAATASKSSTAVVSSGIAGACAISR